MFLGSQCPHGVRYGEGKMIDFIITIVKLRVKRFKDLQFNAVRLKNNLPFLKNSVFSQTILQEWSY